MASATRHELLPMTLRDLVLPRPNILMRAGVQELVRLLLEAWRSQKHLGYCWEFTDAEWVHQLIETDLLAGSTSVAAYSCVDDLPCRVGHSVMMLQRHGRLPMMGLQLDVLNNIIHQLPYEDRRSLKRMERVLLRLGYRFGNPVLPLHAITTNGWLADTGSRGDTVVLEGFDQSRAWMGNKVLEGAAAEIIRRGDAPGSQELWAIAQRKQDSSLLSQLFEMVTSNSTLLDWAIYIGLDEVMRHPDCCKENWAPELLADSFRALLSALMEDTGNDQTVIRALLVRLLLECPVPEYNRLLRENLQ